MYAIEKIEVVLNWIILENKKTLNETSTRNKISAATAAAAVTKTETESNKFIAITAATQQQQKEKIEMNRMLEALEEDFSSQFS